MKWLVMLVIGNGSQDVGLMQFHFRIFNPTEQIKKFDKNHDYIKKWVPNYQSPSYPKPIIDHKMARERCLETYKSALNK